MKSSLFKKMIFCSSLLLSIFLTIPTGFCIHTMKQLVSVEAGINAAISENRDLHAMLISLGVSCLKNPFKQDDSSACSQTTILTKELKGKLDKAQLIKLSSYDLIILMQTGLIHAYINEQTDDLNFIRDACLWFFFGKGVTEGSGMAKQAQLELTKTISPKSKNLSIDALVTTKMPNKDISRTDQWEKEDPLDIIKKYFISLSPYEMVKIFYGKMQISIVRKLPGDPERFQAALATGIGLETSNIVDLITVLDAVSQYFSETYALTALIKEGFSHSFPLEKLFIKSQPASLNASFLTL